MQKLFENWRKYRRDILNEGTGDAMAGIEQARLGSLSPAATEIYRSGFFRHLAYNSDQSLHVRAFAKYLAHDDSTLTEDFLTEDEKRWLVRFILMADAKQGTVMHRQRKRTRDIKGSGYIPSGLDFTPPRGLTRTGGPLGTTSTIIIGYSDYDRISKKNPRHSEQDLTGGMPYQQFEKFLGQFTAAWDGEDTIQISDTYDFSGKKFEDFSKQLQTAVKGAAAEFLKNPSISGPLYKFIRKLTPHPDVGTPYKVDIALTGVKHLLPFVIRQDRKQRHDATRAKKRRRARRRGRRLTPRKTNN